MTVGQTEMVTLADGIHTPLAYYVGVRAVSVNMTVRAAGGGGGGVSMLKSKIC